MPGKSVHSLWNIELFCLLITVESSCCMSRLFIEMALLRINPIVAFSLLSLPTTQVVFSFIRFNIFDPFHKSQTLKGTVIGFKHNLPNFASTYDTHICVASNDGTFRSRYLTDLLFCDAFSKIALIKLAQPRHLEKKQTAAHSQICHCLFKCLMSHQSLNGPPLDAIQEHGSTSAA